MLQQPKKNIPKLRFPEFQAEWEKVQIREFIEERKDFADSSLPLYSLTIENGIVPKSKRYERSFLVKSNAENYKLMKPRDFAFNPMNLRFGALAMHKGNNNVAVSKYYNIFYCTRKGIAEYLEPYLTSYNMIQFYNKMSTGTLEEKKRVHYLDFIHFKRSFPALPEQQKIGTFLSIVDKRIQQITLKKELLKQYKKGVIHKIFSQEVRFKDKDGKEFPKWEVKAIGDITERVVERVNVVKEEKYQQIGIRSHGKGVFHKEFVTGESLGNKRVFWVKKDVFILNIVFAWEQAVAKTSEKEMGMIASHRFPMYKPKNNELDIDFLLFLFLTKKGKYLLELASPGGAGRNKTLGQKEFEKLKITIPSYDEQKKISAFLQELDLKIDTLQKQLTQTQTFKKGLLQQMFV